MFRLECLGFFCLYLLAANTSSSDYSKVSHHVGVFVPISQTCPAVMQEVSGFGVSRVWVPITSPEVEAPTSPKHFLDCEFWLPSLLGNHVSIWPACFRKCVADKPNKNQLSGSSKELWQMRTAESSACSGLPVTAAYFPCLLSLKRVSSDSTPLRTQPVWRLRNKSGLCKVWVSHKPIGLTRRSDTFISIWSCNLTTQEVSRALCVLTSWQSVTANSPLKKKGRTLQVWKHVYLNGYRGASLDLLIQMICLP